MGNFTGGSAYAMVQQIAEGYLLVTERSLQRLTAGELDRLGFELEKLLREVRGAPPPLEDLQAMQKRSRKIQRLNTCRRVLSTYRQRRRT